MNRPPWTKVLTVSLVVVLLGGYCVLRDWRYTNLATTSFAEASQHLPAFTTYETARQWLRDNGFHVLTAGSNVVSTVTHSANTDRPTHFTTVTGYKLLGSDLLGDRWMMIEVYFTMEGEFLHLELNPRSRPPPRWSTPTTAGTSR